MKSSPLIYYVMFPLVVFGLCSYAYYLGWSRGRQEVAVSRPARVEPTPAPQAHSTEELTFFRKLKEPESVGETFTPVPSGASLDSSAEAKKGEFVLQMNAFRDVGRAEETTDHLKNSGFPAYVRASKSKKGKLHRVLVGPYASKESTSLIQKELIKKGFAKGIITRLSQLESGR